MDEKSDNPEAVPANGLDKTQNAMGQVSDGSRPDPSHLLASAAEALDQIDDPVFEGAPVDAPKPQPVRKSSDVSGDYARTVLSIKTPVAVVLAKKKITIDGIINLVPGSMLTFEAHCDEPLTLEAGGHAIATGETVKIGDKFGLRIRQLLDSAG